MTPIPLSSSAIANNQAFEWKALGSAGLLGLGQVGWDFLANHIVSDLTLLPVPPNKRLVSPAFLFRLVRMLAYPVVKLGEGSAIAAVGLHLRRCGAATRVFGQPTAAPCHRARRGRGKDGIGFSTRPTAPKDSDTPAFWRVAAAPSVGSDGAVPVWGVGC